MTSKQLSAVRCALADLIGSLQAYQQGDTFGHNWAAHKLSIDELAEAFGLTEEVPEDITKEYL